jgi:hypothetical protein
MKTTLMVNKLLCTAMLTIVSVCFSAYASGSDFPSQKVKENFMTRFQDAENIKWEKAGPLYYATFSNAGESWIAFLQKEGSIVATGRRISFKNLPLLVQQNVQPVLRRYEKKFGAFQQGCIYEMTQSGITDYFIPFENDNYTLALQSTSNGTVTVVAKKAKHKSAVIETNGNVMAKK